MRDTRRAPASSMLRRQMWLVAAMGLLALLGSQLPLSALHIPLDWYLPIHSMLEVAALVIAFLVYATVWNTPHPHSSVSLLLIGTALAAGGVFDFFHLMSIQGMPVLVTPSSPQKSIAFHLCARLVVTLTLLGVSWMPLAQNASVRARVAIPMSGAVLVAGVVWLVLFNQASLPVLFEPVKGVTMVKTVCEWAVMAALVGAGISFLRQARQSQDDFHPLMAAAVFIAAIGEFFLTKYFVGNDGLNLVAHIYKCLSYWLIFRAMFVVSFRKPYRMLADETAKLQAANQTMRVQSLALDATITPVVLSDLEGRITWQNKAAQRTLAPLRAGGALSLFAAPFASTPALADEVRACLSAGEAWHGTVEHAGASGQSVYLETTLTPWRDESGKVEGYVGVSEDVTEGVRSHLRYQRVLATALDGFMVCDLQGNLLEVSQAYAQMTGYSVAELLSMNVADLSVHRSRAVVIDRLRAAVERRLAHFSTQYRHKDGHVIAADVSLAYDPVLQHVNAFFRDTTERDQAVLVQKDLERQLQQSQKMQALGQLTGGIAHDFNNILASVLGYSKLALDRHVPDKTSKLAKYLGEVVTASERARDLVSKMLSFARTRPSNSATRVQPSMIVREVEGMLRPSIPSRVELNCQCVDDLPIHIDPGELNQMLVNLIINARDAIDGPGRIDVRLRRVSLSDAICASSQVRLNGVWLALEVSDTGCGIDDASMPRLFDPFFTTKEVGKGTGLGLSMVQGMLRRAGGHVVVTSLPGHGTCIQLLFPIATDEPVALAAPEVQPPAPPGDGQRIWVLDDDPAIARFFGELLSRKGYQVSQFNSALEVLERFESGRADAQLLITDQTMPRLSGMDLALRVHLADPSLPIFLCSGFADEYDEATLRARGIERVFAKPVPIPELLTALADTLASAAALQRGNAGR